MQEQIETAVGGREITAPIKELRDSLVLLGFLVSSMAAYVAVGLAVVKLFSGP